MQLSTTEREQLYAILQQYDENPQVQRMREFIQHGDVTTYQHCKNVVRVSFWLNRRLHLHADETSLAVGAFLHDFYLYDWHKRSTFHGLRRLFEMHGFSHPGYACVNAQRVFHITKKEQNIIASHMWPLTFRHVPTCREAVIVCLADKYCAVVESMFRRSRVAAAGDDAAAQTAASEQLDRAISVWVNAVTEAYPDLKANTQFVALQDELVGTENRVAKARDDYNAAAKDYNTAIRKFPQNLIAGMFGFEKADYFEAAAGTESAPTVSF